MQKENSLFFEIKQISHFNGLCRHALISDIPHVARLHLAAFPDFFLTKLGFDFLCVMYKAFWYNPVGVFIVCQDIDGKLTGFAVGVYNSKIKDRWLAMRFLPMFFIAALPSILKHPRLIIGRLISRFFQIGNSFTMQNNSALLRSIGVHPLQRGGGAASALLDSFERVSILKGSRSVYLTTDQYNNERALKFYERHGYIAVERYKQDGVRWMYLMSKDV